MNAKVSAYLSRRLIDRRSGHRAAVLSRFDEIRDRQVLSQERADDIRRESLARLLVQARDHVEHFKSHLSGRKITTDNAEDVLATLPIMERSDIQQEPTAFISSVAEPFIDDATGGSTGTPMRFKIDRPTQIAREASIMWSDSLTGWCYGDSIAMLWGSDRDVRGVGQSMRSWLRWWIENRRWYNAFEMGERQMEAFHRALKRFSPGILVGYAGSLHVFARYLKSEGLVPSYPLGGIVSSAEALSPIMRSEIENAFGKKVFDRYGNREAGAIAAECEEHDGLHINEADFIVEIDSPEPFQQPGAILITYLSNLAMPFIRYNTGDVGLFKSNDPCKCGRRTARIEPVTGRQSDTIRTASGNLVHGEYFTHVFYETTHVKSFQFVQESTDSYRLRLVADRDAVRSLEAGWRSKILDAVGEQASLSFEYVDEIPLLPSGKRKFTLSLLDSDAGG